MNFLWNGVETMLTILTKLCQNSKTHPSIVKIKKHFKIKTIFSFSHTSEDDIVAIIKGLQNNKAGGGEIP